MIVLRMFSSYKKMFRWNKKCFWHLIGGSGFLNWPSQEVLYRFSVSYVYTFSLSFKTRAFILVHKCSANEIVSRILNLLVSFSRNVLTSKFVFCILIPASDVQINSQVFLVRQSFFWWFSVNCWFFFMRLFLLIRIITVKNTDISDFLK